MEFVIVFLAVISFLFLNLFTAAGTAAAVSFIPAALLLLAFSVWKKNKQ